MLGALIVLFRKATSSPPSPPAPVIRSWGWQSSERCECIFVLASEGQAVAWGRDHNEALAQGWTWCNYDHATFVTLQTFQIWIPPDDLMGVLTMLGLGLVPRPTERLAA